MLLYFSKYLQFIFYIILYIRIYFINETFIVDPESISYVFKQSLTNTAYYKLQNLTFFYFIDVSFNNHHESYYIHPQSFVNRTIFIHNHLRIVHGRSKSSANRA